MSNNQSIIRQIPKGIWVLGLVSMLMDISSEMIHSLLPLFMVTSLGMSAFAVGIVEGIAEATAMIVRVFSGALSDYLGKRKGLILFGYVLGAFSKPVFALTSSMGLVLAARFLDRLGKGIRSTPRDALVADMAPERLRGASFGLRQSLDTLGAFFGPLLASGMMLLWCDNFRMVFWVAVIPGMIAVVLVIVGVREPERKNVRQGGNPLSLHKFKQLGPAYWQVVAIGAIVMLARFSEAFLVLRAQQTGIPMTFVPLVMVAMNCIYAMTSYPFGKLADSANHATLLTIGLCVLLAADIALAVGGHWSVILAGVALWGIHMGMSQGLLATMVACVSPKKLRGVAFGCFNLVVGVTALFSSLTAGFIWDAYGASSTFYMGASCCVISILLLLFRSQKFRSPTL